MRHQEAVVAAGFFPQEDSAVAEHVVDDHLEDRAADVVRRLRQVPEAVGLAHEPNDRAAAPGLAVGLALLFLQAEQPRAEVVAFPSVVLQLTVVRAADASAVDHGCRPSMASTPVQSSGRLWPSKGAISTPE